MSTVGQTIIEQLGGESRFGMMTGAYDILTSPNGVTMKLKGARAGGKKLTGIKITLENDLYTLESFRIHKLECVWVEKRTGIYVDNLRNTFSDMTKLYLNI